MKPDVVFFGDSVPVERVERCFRALRGCDALFCVGTSLAVYSAYRFVREASRSGIQVCLLNVGETRAEREGLQGLIKVESPIGLTLDRVVDILKEERNV